MAVKIPVNPANVGDLTDEGYRIEKRSRARHRALARAIQKLGPDKVWHELHAGYIRNMNDDPDIASVFKSDRNWISRKWGRRGR